MYTITWGGEKNLCFDLCGWHINFHQWLSIQRTTQKAFDEWILNESHWRVGFYFRNKNYERSCKWKALDRPITLFKGHVKEVSYGRLSCRGCKPKVVNTERQEWAISNVIEYI